MSARRVDIRRIKQNRSYDVAELADCLGVHKNTVRHWQRGGLKPLDDKRPVMFHGQAIRAFLAARKASRKCPCPPGTLYCFRCRAARAPAPDSVTFVPINGLSGNLRATCATCGTTMHRRAPKAQLDAILPNHTVQIADGHARLKGCPSPSLYCDLERQA